MKKKNNKMKILFMILALALILVFCFITLKNLRLTGHAIINPPTNVNISKGLLIYYPFNGTANDFSGKNNNGVMGCLNNTMDNPSLANCNNYLAYSPNQGVSGGAYFFKGYNYNVVSPKSCSLPFSGGCGLSYGDFIGSTNPTFTNFSISMWIRSNQTSNTNQALIAKGDDINGRLLLYLEGRNTIVLYIYSNPDNVFVKFTANNTNPIGDDKWHNLIGMRNGDNFSLYLDSILVNTTVYSNVGTYYYLNSFNIGRLGWQRAGVSQGYFTGYIDEVRIYDRALNSNETAWLYRCPSGVCYSS